MALVISGLQTNVQPESSYSVYLNLPEDATVAERQSHLAGAINFFEAQRRSDKSRKFVLDVSHLREVVRATGDFTLTISPIGTPASDAKPDIAEISLSVLS
jgi:hypothetical protein